MTAVVLLCAGGSSRFLGGRPKMLAPFRGRPLVTWAIEHASGAQLGEVFVVVGAVDLSGVLPDDVVAVENPSWSSGQAGSLMVGIAAAEERGHDVVVVGLGDQPMVPPEAWSAVASAESDIAIATFDGQRSPPTRLTAAVWPLLPRTGDVGARALMEARPDLVVEVPCPGRALDIDTAEDMLQWR
jgi:molybdenum cofactor cytidylyltransferase